MVPTDGVEERPELAGADGDAVSPQADRFITGLALCSIEVPDG